METLRLGLVGLGRHGARYARHIVLGDVPGATLTAVWRRDQEAARRDVADLVGLGGAQVRFEPDLRALVAAPDVDAVAVVVPVHRHADIAAAVCEAARPLLIEKPIARTLTEAHQIVDAFEAARRPLMVAQTLRFDPLVQALAERITSIGPVRTFAFEQRLEPRGLAWEDDLERAGGGVLIQTGIHTVDALRFVTRARRVDVLSCSAGRWVNECTEDSSVTTLRIYGDHVDPRGAIGTICTSKIGTSRHVRFMLAGPSGGLEVDLVARTITLVRGRDRTAERIEDPGTIVAVLRAFVDHVQQRAPNLVPGREGLLSLEVVTRAYALAGADGSPRLEGEEGPSGEAEGGANL